MAIDHAFSTRHLPPRQRVPRWAEAVSDRFVESGFKVQAPEQFIASMQHREVDDLRITRIDSAGHGSKRVTRSQRQAARAAEDFFLVSLQLEGACRVSQDGRTALLQPGQFAIYDTRRPYELLLEQDYRQAVLRVPLATLGTRLPGCEDLTATAVAAQGPSSRRLLKAVLAACDEPRAAVPAATAGAADWILRALGSGLRGLQRGEPPAGQRTREAALARIKAHVTRHLGDPQLGVPRIAAALGLSTSYLHQLFRDEGCTLERWIWSQRLAACERALVGPHAAARSITQIAYEHGYSDAAHFSRSFRQRYGRSPREHQAAMGGGDGRGTA